MIDDLESYSEFVRLRTKPMDTQGQLLHATIGLATECGELADTVKRHWAYEQKFDEYNAVEEIGDCLFYLTMALNAMGVPLRTALAVNTGKLVKRYPNGYTNTDAILRADKGEE